MSSCEERNCKKFARGVLKNWEEKKVTNPFTDRKIGFFKKTFRKLDAKCSAYTDCNDKKGLANLGATCYLDSVLFLLLAMENKYIDQYILYKDFTLANVPKTCDKDPKKSLVATQKLQQELVKLAFQMRQGKFSRETTCKNFIRQYGKRCSQSIYPAFQNPNVQRDASEFLEFIFAAFNFSKQFSSEVVGRKKWKVQESDRFFMKRHESVTVNQNDTVIWHVPYTQLEEENDLEDLLRYEFEETLDEENPHYAQSDQVAKTEPMFFMKGSQWFKKLSSFVVFYLERVDRTNPYAPFLETSIEPNESIRGRKLFGIVVQRGYSGGSGRNSRMAEIGGGHYVSYFKCKDTWYLFDDLGPNITEVGSYEDLLETDATTRGVLYFYSK